MKKILLKSFLLTIAFVLLKPSKADAQFCPMGIYNNTTTIGLISQNVYNTFAPGTYNVTMLYSGLMDPACWVVNQPLTINKSQDIMNVLTGTPGGGWGIYFDVSPVTSANNCGGLPADNGLQNGSLSIEIRTLSGTLVVMLNVTDNVIDECGYVVVPVVFGPFSATLLTFPNRVKLDWTTYTEQDVDHFSVEKSIDGITWYKIAHVAAVGNSNSQNNYTWTDNNPASNNYYRIIAVDIDCSRMNTLIRRVVCSSCPATFTPPGITPDCTPPNTSPYISGPSSICDNTAKLYRLHNVKGDAQVTWSFSPSYLATITAASRMVGVVPTGYSGVGTLTATVVKNGVTSSYSVQITFGVPEFWGWCQSTSPGACNGATNFTATVHMLTGTSAGQYKWYQNGTYLGIGSQRTWYNVLPGQVINFQVRYNGPCGQSVWAGSTLGCSPPAKGVVQEAVPKASPRYEIAPNPAKSAISIQRLPPCPPPPAEPIIQSMDTWKAKAPVAAPISETAIIKIFDTQGNLRKTTKMNNASTRLTLNASDLPAGLYFVHVIEPGKETVTLKVLLEK